MLTDKKTEDKYNCYNFTTGGSYQMIQDFYREDGAFVLSYAQKLDTAVGFVMCGRDRLYVVRNMMDHLILLLAVCQILYQMAYYYFFSLVRQYSGRFSDHGSSFFNSSSLGKAPIFLSSSNI